MKLLCSFLVMMLTYVSINCGEFENVQMSYNPAELLSNIFGTKLTMLSENEDAMKFSKEFKLEDINTPRQYDVALDQGRPFTFENNESSFDQGTPEFQDENKKKRRRRRRKSKNQNLPGSSNLVYQRPSQGSFGVDPYVHPGLSALDQPYYRPSPFERPSVATEALSAISGALTSIALYDDQQCVPRLLCEAAGGGKLGSTSLIQSIAGLQPLLTLLSAYNGVSTSPLFIFGRAVFLGMASKGNPGTCRYAYPQCPRDPEKLVHYLNNHNGGFFRFFSAPQGQQNLDQFYNQLSGSYGLYQANLHQNANHNAQTNSYGLYQPNHLIKDGFHEQNQGYGLYKPNGINNQQTYSSTYKHDKFKFQDDNDIEKRILNSPNNNILDDDIDNEYIDTKLAFPDNNHHYKLHNNIRDSRKFKFPDETFKIVSSSNDNIYNDYNNQDYKRKGKSILFPDSDKPRYTNNHKYINTHTTNINVNDYVFDYEHNFYVKNMNSDDDGPRTVYVVRGDGDPNHPEVVKVKPGESIK